MIMAKNYTKKIVYDMLRLRLSQMMVNENYKDGKFKIPIHLAFGHEAIVVAINEIMNEEDKLILSHRNIAYNLARLGRLKPIMDEYFLKSTGLDNGKTGSMNLINPSRGVIYSSSILGNNFSVAVGVAMSQKIKQNNGITIILGGDGAIEEGSFHESIMMFKSLNLGGLMIIENNEWSMATKINERRCPIDLEKFTAAYGVKYVRLDGNNPLKYIEELKKLRNFSEKNQELVCIEVMVTTLGDWRMKTPEFPDGKFINYHAGPAPTIDLHCPPIIRNKDEDPIFVLTKFLSESELNKISEKIHKELVEELK